MSSSCQTVEYLVYEYQYEVPIRGVVNVRCQSCPYCLDLPYLTIREIRDPQTAATRLLSSVETYENE